MKRKLLLTAVLMCVIMALGIINTVCKNEADGGIIVNLLDFTNLVPVPVPGATPETQIDTAQYSGNIIWYAETGTHSGDFEYGKIYTAEINLSAKNGFTLTGLGSNSFIHNHAETIHYSGGKLTIGFGKTFIRTVDLLNLSTIIPSPVSGELSISQAYSNISNIQYMASISWFYNGNPFEDFFVLGHAYTAVIRMEEQTGYTFEGVTESDFVHENAEEISWDAANLALSIKFYPQTLVVNDLNLRAHVSGPVSGFSPQLTVDTVQYGGSIVWFESGSPDPHEDPFKLATVYTAAISLEAKTGYTFKGFAANRFVYSGATSISNAENSGTVTIIFPATLDTLDAAIPVILTEPQDNIFYTINEGAVLSIAAVTPDSGTLSYQWYRADAINAEGVIISGATNIFYSPPTNIPGIFYYYVIVTNTNTAVLGDTRTSIKSAVATVEIKNVRLPLVYKVNDIGVFSGEFTEGNSVSTILSGTAVVADGTRLNGTNNGKKVINTGNDGWITMGNNVGRVLRMLDTWSIELYVFMPANIPIHANGDSPVIFAFSTDNAVNDNTHFIHLPANTGRWSIRTRGWASNSWDTAIFAVRLPPGNQAWHNPRGQWRHLVYTFGDDDYPDPAFAQRSFNVFMDGELIYNIRGDSQSITWPKTTTVLRELQFGWLGRAANANDHRTVRTQYYMFGVHGRALKAEDIGVLGFAEKLGELNGRINSISMDFEPDLKEGRANVAAGVTVGTLTTDGGILPLTYSLVSGEGDRGNGSFSISGNELRVGSAALNSGVKSVRVRVTDNTGEYFEQVFVTIVEEAAPPADPLRLRYTFNNRTGDIVNSQTGGQSGTLLNGATIDTVNGIGVLFFPGTGQPLFDMGLEAADIINIASEYTVSVFVTSGATIPPTIDNGLWIFSHTTGDYQDGPNSSISSLFYRANRRIEANVGAPGVNRQWPTAGEAGNLLFTVGRWQHLMMVHKGNTVDIYLNGIRIHVHTSDVTATPSQINRLNHAWIGRGRELVHNYALNHKFADFRIYSKALEAAEVGGSWQVDYNNLFNEITATLATLNESN